MAKSAHAKPYRRSGDGLLVMVRLTPKSARDAIEGLEEHDGRTVLKARVRAAPEKGKANAALEKLVAKWIGIPKSSVALASGGGSRLKSLRLAGDADAIAEALDERIGETR